jgi:hypothetical protein
MSGRIQLSQKTASLLIAAKKEHWVKKRDDAIHAKGKGVLSTVSLVLVLHACLLHYQKQSLIILLSLVD